MLPLEESFFINPLELLLFDQTELLIYPVKLVVLEPIETLLTPFITSVEMRTKQLQTKKSLESLAEISHMIDALPLFHPLPHSKPSSGYGTRTHPVTGKKIRHNGVDFVGKRKAFVLASNFGIVKHAGRKGGSGNLVIIRHGYGVATHYAHLSEILIKENDVVYPGQPIGIQGNTGRSTGEHLHYEVRF